MFKDKDNIILSITPSKKIAKEYMSWVLTFLTILGILSTVSLLFWRPSPVWNWSRVLLVVILFLVYLILDRLYAWYKNIDVSYNKDKKKLVYTEYSIVDSLGNNKHIYELEYIEKYKVLKSSNRIKCYGRIVCKFPLSKPKYLKKCVLEGGVSLSELEDTIEKFKSDKLD